MSVIRNGFTVKVCLYLIQPMIPTNLLHLWCESVAKYLRYKLIL